MSRPRAALLVTGVVVIGYAAFGALADLGGKLGGVLLFLAAVLVVHDAVWLPLVLAAGALLGRFVPARHRGVVRIAAFAGVAVTLVALPLALGFGRSPDNPSVLPLNYGRNLALVLLGLTVLAAVLVARTRIRAALRRVPVRARRGRGPLGAALAAVLASPRARAGALLRRRRKDSERRNGRGAG